MAERNHAGTVVLLTVLVLLAGVATVTSLGGATSRAPVDVVILVDRTGSMADNANQTLADATALANGLEAHGADARYAVITYADQQVLTMTRFTSDPAAMASAVSAIHYTTKAHENTSLAILSALESSYPPDLSFRAGARPVVVVFTNEDDDGYCALGAQATASVDAHGAMLVAVARDPPRVYTQDPEPCLTDHTQNDLKVIAEQQVQDGVWVDPSAPDFSAVYDGLGLTASTSPSPSPSPSFERVSASLNRTSVAVGEPVGVTVTVRNAGDAAGTYHAVLTGDTALLRTEDVRLAPGERHTFHWSVSFNDTSPQIRLFEHYRYIGDVQVTAPTPTPVVGTPTPSTVTASATPTSTNAPPPTPTSAPTPTARQPVTAPTPTPPPSGSATAPAPATTQVAAGTGGAAVGGSGGANGARRGGAGFDYRYLLVLLMGAALVLVVISRAGL